MARTAAGPWRAPSRKLSVRSRGAPKIAAAAGGPSATSSGDDARKGVAGGAKLGDGGRLVTICQFQERLHEARQGERGAVHGWGVDAQRLGQALHAVAHAHVVKT